MPAVVQDIHNATPREGFGLLLVSWGLFVAGSFALMGGGGGGALSLATLEVGTILLPAVLWGTLRRLPVFPTPAIHRPGFYQVGLLAVAGPAAALGLAGLMAAWAPGREEERLLRELVMGFAPWSRYALFALLPALCEEVLFRGAFLTCLARWGEVPACVTSAVAFGLFHGSLLRFLPVAALGYALALVVRRTGNLWPAVVIHALHNTLVLTLAPLEPVTLPPALYGATLALGIFLFTLAWVVWKKVGTVGWDTAGETANGRNGDGGERKIGE